jgi:hypothetical protein
MGPASERERPWWTPGSTRPVDVLLSAVAAIVLLLVLSAASGQIPVNQGYGYDGADYVEMVNDGVGAGTPSTRLRPAVVLVATAVDRAVFDDPIKTFRAINLVFAGLLALILADLSRRYGASRAATLVLILNLGLCISTAKMFSFYPTLVDLGAYAFMAAGAWAIVTGRRALIVVTCVVAVLSREFAGVLLLFGLVREVRLRRPILPVLATYAPIAAAVVWVRWFAASHNVAGEETRALATASLIATLRQNLVWWHDPQYAAFWVYFAATLFGGVSLALVTSPRPWARCLRREPEWLAIVVPIAAVTVVGYIDMWRYFAFIVPAVPALWAWTVADLPPSKARWCAAAVTVATVVTQRPWQPMDVAAYFRDWFPYFLVIEEPRTAAATLWPLWTWRLATAATLATVVLWSVRRPRPHAPLAASRS